ncbi:transcriptional regulator [Zhengella mangrovi]|uniref:Transcriptional regulator n=2 Tax=Zhengella mangrovi TaxID=1982044 RepID=A0A2G1QSB7_9HYPH|nr:transcriptional regulator [Zhengella mangrovi]
MARRLAALAHPARLRILRRLACADACCCKDVVATTGLAQSTVSQHLKVLVEAGFVAYEPDAQRSRYSLDRRALAMVRQDVDLLLAGCSAGSTCS